MTLLMGLDPVVVVQSCVVLDTMFIGVNTNYLLSSLVFPSLFLWSDRFPEHVYCYVADLDLDASSLST